MVFLPEVGGAPKAPRSWPPSRRSSAIVEFERFSFEDPWGPAERGGLPHCRLANYRWGGRARNKPRTSSAYKPPDCIGVGTYSAPASYADRDHLVIWPLCLQPVVGLRHLRPGLSFGPAPTATCPSRPRLAARRHGPLLKCGLDIDIVLPFAYSGHT